MDKKISIIKNTILIISICLYLSLVYNSNNGFRVAYERCIFFMILLCLFIFSYGLVKNNKKVYKNNSTLYILIFLLLLGSLTFFVGRGKFELDFEGTKYGQYELFYTIKAQLERGSRESILRNIVGNLVMLIPFSFILMIKSKKFNNLFFQSLIILPLTYGIELLQQYSGVGAFDIDDIFLNYIGAIIFTFLITRFHLMDKIRELFYKDFHLKEKLKYMVFFGFCSFLVIYDLVIFFSFF